MLTVAARTWHTLYMVVDVKGKLVRLTACVCDILLSGHCCCHKQGGNSTGSRVSMAVDCSQMAFGTVLVLCGTPVLADISAPGASGEG